MARPGNEPKWAGPYMKRDVPADPWGRPYLYRQPGEHGEVDLSTLGSDGRAGGSGDASDVQNW